MMDIKNINQSQAYRMLQCLAVAIRPLSVAELAELLAFEFDAAKGGIPKLNADWRWEDHEQAVLSTCSSLITIVPSDYASPIVQFSHFSVKEFLLSDRLATSTKDISQYHIVLKDANTLIAGACLGVLLQDPVDENAAATALLARYAAEHWVTHAQIEGVASRVRDGMERLFDPDRPYFSAWVKLFDVDTRHWAEDPQMKREPGAAPLYYAARCGFHGIAEHLVPKYPQYANAIGGEAGTALHSASREGHIAVVRSLLKCGVDVDALGRWNQSPLQLASLGGCLDVLQYLLDHGADPNFHDDEDITPLRRAAVGGCLENVRVLLEHHADASAQDKEGFTAIHAVLLDGGPKGDYPQIVRLLLEYGANLNARDNEGRTLLHLVSGSSLTHCQGNPGLSVTVRLEIARILLSQGADVDEKDEAGRTPLQGALASEQAEMAQLLSEYCSNVK
jgi:ankyrin repeat protein